MGQFVLDLLDFTRSRTLQAMESLSEEEADRIPDGFRNSVRWNLGHIYVVLERFAFYYIGLPQHLPEGFKELFESGTSPLTKPEGLVVPTLQELRTLLAEQPGRIRRELAGRLEEIIVPPYTTSAGMKLETPEQFLSFNAYHEGMHINAIKQYKRLIER
ncbi:DinB family protein [Gorillibacterium massiliense]|uniref:DinB family protein n=1 Tax=Gorillibacterium massiliense TaxID=1280390 RepID=UPI0004B9D494|nr:DinB family protein [Gorillibacterium massiliense]